MVTYKTLECFFRPVQPPSSQSYPSSVRTISPGRQRDAEEAAETAQAGPSILSQRTTTAPVLQQASQTRAPLQYPPRTTPGASNVAPSRAFASAPRPQPPTTRPEGATAPRPRDQPTSQDPTCRDSRPNEEDGSDEDSEDPGLPGQRLRPRKRPCLTLHAALAQRAARSAPAPPPPVPLERRGSFACLLAARSVGRVPPWRELWWHADPGLLPVGCWDASLRLRAGCVVQQDAVTHMEWSGGGGSDPGGPRLAAAQANGMVRIVPYGVLRERAEARRGAAVEEAEAREGLEAADGEVAGQAQLLPWDDLAGPPSAWRRGGPGPVLSIQTHGALSGLGWDPRRPGRLGYVDRSSAAVTLLDLGDGGGGGSRGSGQGASGFRRSYLTAAPTSASAAVGSLTSLGGGSAGGAARALVYMRYGSCAAPYTLAAAGRASGEGGAVLLWDERAGRAPVSRLACPGGRPLVAAPEPSHDGLALVGVVQPGMLVMWDVRRAASAASAAAVLSLGGAAPTPSAVVGAWDAGSALAAGGCPRPVVSSVAMDPRDGGRLALLMQDGSSALWSLASASPTHVNPSAAATAAAAREAARGGVPIPVPATARHVSAAAAASPAAAVSLLGGALYGSWDADVAGFWHPAAARRSFTGGGPAAAAAGAEAMEDVSATHGPGVALTDFQSDPGVTRVGPRAGIAGSAAGAAMGAPRTALATRMSAVSVALPDWPLCVACERGSGDVVWGTLGGRLAIGRKR